jgi:hypothetical protein
MRMRIISYERLLRTQGNHTSGKKVEYVGDKLSYLILTREWSGLSARNLTWNFANLQSPSSNDNPQNFSCRYAVQGCEKVAQIWNVQFKFPLPRTRVTAPRLAVGLYSPVHSNGLCGPSADKAVKDLIQIASAHTHTHTHIYIYIYICIMNRYHTCYIRNQAEAVGVILLSRVCMHLPRINVMIQSAVLWGTRACVRSIT